MISPNVSVPYILRVRPLRWRGVIYHDALVIPDDSGMLWVMDITQHSIRPRLTKLDTYLAMGDPIIKISPLPKLDVETTWATFEILQSRRTYNVVRYNCDHFIDELQFYRKRSEQLRQKIGLAMLAMVLILAFAFLCIPE